MLLLIKWYGIFHEKDGKIDDEFIYPEDKIVEIVMKLRKGDLSPIKKIIEKYEGEEIKFVGELKNEEEFKNLMIKVAEIESRENISEDFKIIQILNTYDDLVSIINLLKEREMEWKKLEKIKGEKYEISSDVQEEIKNLENLKRRILEKLEVKSNELVPNLTSLLGSIITARLISQAGGLKRLVRMPASTIQVLGAEESFFRHLKKGTKCPKHGIIFQVPEIRKAPRNIRGKLARYLAGKIAIATRVDYYKGEFMGNKLKEEFMERIGELRDKK